MNEKEIVVTAKDAAPFMRPLLAKLGIAIDDDGPHIDGTPQMSGLFNMPQRPMFKVKR